MRLPSASKTPAKTVWDRASSHRLEIQARVLDVAVRNNRQHLQFLRKSAERLLADRTAQLDRTPDASLQAVLRAQDERVWNLQVRDIDAPIRGIGTQQLAVTPGLHRDEPTFVLRTPVTKI
ncbi:MULTISPECIES: hypothetical protein [unclassified Paraburkholderia]|uniref:hypothetical protein n=1 Tax=unclassified Paraburkholderia TaxID=2615204 RepID=UPI00160C5CF6|nr:MULTISPECIES: hypothetical protein [unclassified Paraburkholderia]MBB5445326.1 hypothetical protein [Paraburkholderia sp. WSM4177]MBB5485874.1 hypothetical protein [Paraburkholderia sp. WSM4180]